jgi:hypothetical protein
MKPYITSILYWSASLFSLIAYLNLGQHWYNLVIMGAGVMLGFYHYPKNPNKPA